MSASAAWHPTEIEYRPRLFGASVAYLHKIYHARLPEGGSRNLNAFGLPGGTSGIRFGLTAEPYFGHHVSMATGIFYEYFMVQNHISRWKLHEHLFYCPMHVKYWLPVDSRLAFFALAGPAVSWGMNIGLTHRSDTPLNPHYDTAGWPRRAQVLGEFGIGVAWRTVSLQALYGIGLLTEDSMPQGIYSSVRQQRFALQLDVKF